MSNTLTTDILGRSAVQIGAILKSPYFGCSSHIQLDEHLEAYAVATEKHIHSRRSGYRSGSRLSTPPGHAECVSSSEAFQLPV
jgi:hypothetical protein